MNQRQGFTLIELLIVISIIGTIMGMLMPIVTIAGRAARTSATRSAMIKTEVALRLFRSDIGSFPWQSSYANLAASAPWTNRLYYHLGTDISTSDYNKIRADGDAAAVLYNYKIGAPSASAHAFTNDDVSPTATLINGWGIVAMLNRMAAERARLAIYAGNTDITGCVLQTPWKPFPLRVRRVLPTTPLLAAPVSAGNPGWAKDYLNGELEKRFINGEAILDAWKRPLIYVGQIVEGMTAAPNQNLFGQNTPNCNATEYGLNALGRITLGEEDRITGEPLTVNPPALPDVANLRQSDRRLYAAPDYELDFELWSAGPDGRAAWMRDHAWNTDNVSLLNYDKTIP